MDDEGVPNCSCCGISGMPVGVPGIVETGVVVLQLIVAGAWVWVKGKQGLDCPQTSLWQFCK